MPREARPLQVTVGADCARRPGAESGRRHRAWPTWSVCETESPLLSVWRGLVWGHRSTSLTPWSHGATVRGCVPGEGLVTAVTVWLGGEGPPGAQDWGPALEIRGCPTQTPRRRQERTRPGTPVTPVSRGTRGVKSRATRPGRGSTVHPGIAPLAHSAGAIAPLAHSAGAPEEAPVPGLADSGALGTLPRGAGTRRREQRCWWGTASLRRPEREAELPGPSEPPLPQASPRGECHTRPPSDAGHGVTSPPPRWPVGPPCRGLCKPVDVHQEAD